ncbi:GIY-YIG nuclease family protein [Ruegeria arenilitoris]|uniref:GIY-YIG nuclease family protein n=1 Tax=Ruegeria arenilitoris TaxID=1173585 RepID=UPI001480188C|nr:GIY-YIG nuclease family protein [Ruegeria arenilitoris]
MAEIVYVLTNPSMPGLVKIGLTRRDDPISRMAELFSTGVPEPFQCEAAWEVGHAIEIESKMHAKFSSVRVNPSREFFKISAERAIEVLRSFGLRDITHEVQKKLELANEAAFRRPVQNWLEMGYSVGDKFFAGETGEFVTIVDGRTVSYRGELMSLSQARIIIRRRFPELPASGAFHKDGELIQARYDRTYGPPSQSYYPTE